MKIDGVDTVLSTVSAKSSEIQKSETVSKPEPEMDKKTLDLDSINIAHLTDFEKRELPISEKVVIDAIERANKAILGGNRKFEFSIHEKTKQIMIKVIDSDTNEIVREIPPEKTLDMVAKMWEMAGLIVDERR